MQQWYLKAIFPSQSRHRLVSNNKLRALNEIVADDFTSSLQPAVSLDVCCSEKQASATALVVPVNRKETGYPLMQSYFFREANINSITLE